MLRIEEAASFSELGSCFSGSNERSKGRRHTNKLLPIGEKPRITVIRPSIKTEIFVCDECGQRKRLKTASRHWCDSCSHGSPVEMRPARDKRVVQPQKATTTH